MSAPDMQRIPLSRSQQNLYNGVLQDGDSSLYLIGKQYRFLPIPLPRFLAALEAMVCENPVQLCVLETPATETDHPCLVPRLRFGDIVRVRSSERHCENGDFALEHTWSTGILDTALVRYTVYTDQNGDVTGLDVHAHHIVVDGGATALIEAGLAHHLSGAETSESPSLAEGLAKLAAAHLREQDKVDQAAQRLGSAVQRELAEDARLGGGSAASRGAGAAAKGVLRESVTISGVAFDAILRLSDAEQVPLNVLVAAAALAVDAGMRHCTDGLLVHAVDNRFADPELNVATCLVNSVAHPVRFAPFASVREVVRGVDRAYVKAVRRRWLREEHYRRMYLAINRTTHVDALTLNFIRETCAPSLRPFLAEAPVATDIGPVEARTVASVLDEGERTLHVAVWDRADQKQSETGVADRIAQALQSMVSLWDQPIAKAVGEWFEVGPDGSVEADVTNFRTTPPQRAWFVDASEGVRTTRALDRWIAWLVRNGVASGDVVVLTDDGSRDTIDCLIGCHLAGCGYSVCDTAEQLSLRARTVAEHLEGATAHVLDLGDVGPEVDDEARMLAGERIRQVAQDISLGAKTAYVMPTSGSTGQPKLVRVTHESLALFCAAAVGAYGWGPRDTILQCAPLTSDISVEEIFGAVFSGAQLVRSSAMRSGDLDRLAVELEATGATVVDLPTAVWHLLCDDGDALETLRRSDLRQIVIGGEAVRSAAVQRWVNSAAAQCVALVSSYGPTETTVVASYLPIASEGTPIAAEARSRLGRPMVPGTVFVAFGEVVIVGDLVSTGYLGTDDRSFGDVTTGDGSRRRAFATADRVIVDAQGFPVFAGRKDDVVKVSGKRIDLAEITRHIASDAAITDVAVELHDGRLGVWFQAGRTHDTSGDPAARIRNLLVSNGVSSFFVVQAPSIPRKPNGKVDSENLRAMPQFMDAVRDDDAADAKAAGLARMWSGHLGTAIQPNSSLLAAGIGSLDLIRILPDTRRFLGRQVSILDLISADTAANLVSDLACAATITDAWMDRGTAAEIQRDLDQLPTPATRPRARATHSAGGTIIVLGASGILGTGFAGAILDLRRSGARCPDVVLATRSQPEHGPWPDLRHVEGVRIQQLAADFGAVELDDLIRETGAAAVINCIGNTNVLVPYRELRRANVDLVSEIVGVCANRGVRLVHLSTFVVNADVTDAQVTDPRGAPYPYAASKAIAELVVAGAPDGLDFTIVRLPRVLGEECQLQDSADILVSVVDACAALRAHPALNLIEEVTTGRAAATAILRLLPEVGGTDALGRGLSVVRGEAVDYAKLLGGFAPDQLGVAQWKQRLDDSEWARANPRRWSVVDGWVDLGVRLGARSYGEYLADSPTLGLAVESVAEIAAPAEPVRSLLARLFAPV
ncbi:AMP-binding protein [Mycobacterium sp. TY814]|uniref:AMP-binding protein n=1 Tax=unclassified Mycobacterium TaxID=2642494 RepID=UPI002740469C|nr:AMP-binding protein [Mycobacterium sp. TY814]MDP7723329.1 AMP-binding protein [Mycobacterium sp. TY814]